MMRDELVAWLDGECDAAQDAAITQALEQDIDLRAHLAALVRQQLLLAEVCARPDAGSRHARAASSRRKRTDLRLPARRTPLVWLAAAAGVLLAVGLLLLPQASRPSTVVVALLTTGGDGVVRLARERREALTVGTPLHAGDRLEVPALTFASVRFPDGSTLTIAGDSTVAVQPAAEEHLHLERGSVTAEVAPRAGGTPFAIGTIHGRATVLGTRFTLAVTRNATHLQVAHGRVRLSGTGAGAVFAAGERASLGTDGRVVRATPATPAITPPVPSVTRAPAQAGVALLPTDPWAGASVGTDDGRGIPRELIRVSGQPFTHALRITTPDDLVADPRHTGEYALRVRLTLTAAVRQGDAVLARLWLRSGDAAPAQTRLVVEDPVSHARSLGAALLATPQWRLIELPFHLVADGAAGTVEAQLWLGRRGQTIEVADLTLTNHGPGALRAIAPQATYEGRAADAPWRSAAQERITGHRTSRVTVTVVDAAGQAVPEATVQVRVGDPALRFGTAVVAERLLGTTPDDVRYRDELLRRFTLAVPENALKWAEREGDPRLSEQAVAWLTQRHLPVRGHTLVWLRHEHLPADLRAQAEDPLAIGTRLDRHLHATLTAFDGRFCAWDVVNDPYSADLLLNGDGRERIAGWFATARMLDPATPRFLNLYGVLDDGGADLRRQEFYERLITDLLATGVPLDGLGLQCHQDRNLTPPERLNAVLQRFARFGLPLHVTEFEVDVDDERLQADYTRDALTVFASQPAVRAVLAWGFWAGDHHRPQAAMLSQDWSRRPNGQVWDELVLAAWSGAADGVSDSSGACVLDSRRGGLEITVHQGGRSATTTVDATGASTTVQVRIE